MGLNVPHETFATSELILAAGDGENYQRCRGLSHWQFNRILLVLLTLLYLARHNVLLR